MMEIDLSEKEIIKGRITDLPDNILKRKKDIFEVSNFIHENPELGSEEFLSSKFIIEKLRSLNVEVEENFLGMKTAFRAKVGNGNPKVAVLAEYDALPIGHACGHNIIGAWAFGVFSALASSIKKGTLYLVGTPAEEGRGEYASSKVRIAPVLKKDGIEAVFTIHPGGEWEVGGNNLGIIRHSLVFRGKNAHAAASPEMGLNALDAAVTFYTNFRMLHGMLGRHHQVVLSAVIKDGGVAPNIIPGRSEVWYDIRSEDDDFLSKIEELALGIADSSAEMNRCKVEHAQLTPRLSPRKPDSYLDSIYFKYAKKYLGDSVKSPEEAYRDMPRASSDVGNVSQLIPTVHLGVKVGPKGMPGHSEEMKYFSLTNESQEALLTAVAIGYDSITDYLNYGRTAD